MSSMDSAVSKAANNMRRRLKWCGWIPAALSDSKVTYVQHIQGAHA